MTRVKKNIISALCCVVAIYSRHVHIEYNNNDKTILEHGMSINLHLKLYSNVIIRSKYFNTKQH